MSDYKARAALAKLLCDFLSESQLDQAIKLLGARKEIGAKVTLRRVRSADAQDTSDHRPA
jgi:hypothetical protein